MPDPRSARGDRSNDLVSSPSKRRKRATVRVAVAPEVIVVGLTVAVTPIGAVADSVSICAVPAEVAVCTVKVLFAFNATEATLGEICDALRREWGSYLEPPRF